MFATHIWCVFRPRRLKLHRLTTNRADSGVKAVREISETLLEKLYDLGET